LKTHQTKLNLVDTEKENEEIEIISKIPRFQGLLPPQKKKLKKEFFQNMKSRKGCKKNKLKKKGTLCLKF
jgi:hypothetical protein